jgi:hypothetical protein
VLTSETKDSQDTQVLLKRTRTSAVLRRDHTAKQPALGRHRERGSTERAKTSTVQHPGGHTGPGCALRPPPSLQRAAPEPGQNPSQAHQPPGPFVLGSLKAQSSGQTLQVQRQPGQSNAVLCPRASGSLPWHTLGSGGGPTQEGPVESS